MVKISSIFVAFLENMNFTVQKIGRVFQNILVFSEYMNFIYLNKISWIISPHCCLCSPWKYYILLENTFTYLNVIKIFGK